MRNAIEAFAPMGVGQLGPSKRTRDASVKRIAKPGSEGAPTSGAAIEPAPPGDRWRREVHARVDRGRGELDGRRAHLELGPAGLGGPLEVLGTKERRRKRGGVPHGAGRRGQEVDGGGEGGGEAL